MCMRILDMAGLEIAKDDQREPDKDNIHGYFEIDRIIMAISMSLRREIATSSRLII